MPYKETQNVSDVSNIKVELKLTRKFERRWLNWEHARFQFQAGKLRKCSDFRAGEVHQYSNYL